MEIAAVSSRISSVRVAASAAPEQNARASADAEAARQASAVAERQRTTVNANGQTVGTRVNTTA